MGGVRVLWCDADGNLFPSEEPAYEASAGVTNDFLVAMGVHARYTAEELRLGYTGKNFRTTAPLLCRDHGVEVPPDVLEEWVRREAEVVTAHLGRTLRPDPAVLEPLQALARDRTLALVSSSASARLDVCLAATGLDHLFPPSHRFSAEDSLVEPRGKPDPAIYHYAGSRLRCGPEEGVAIEDSPVGVQAAVAAGFATLGNVQFVPVEERADRSEALMDAGATRVVDSWSEVATAVTLLHYGVRA
jgi:beta-phosphoglucomutase-like phosphatase (HAD superfamily)